MYPDTLRPPKCNKAYDSSHCCSVEALSKIHVVAAGQLAGLYASLQGVAVSGPSGAVAEMIEFNKKRGLCACARVARSVLSVICKAIIM